MGAEREGGVEHTLRVVLNWMRWKPTAVRTARQNALTYVHHMMFVLMVENHRGPICFRLLEYCKTWATAHTRHHLPRTDNEKLLQRLETAAVSSERRTVQQDHSRELLYQGGGF